MKKTLKTLVILAMLCVVTITLVGCGKDEDINSDRKTNNESIANSEKEGATVEISRGEWQGDKYVNDFAGIKFNLPEGWEKYSDERLAEIMNTSVTSLNEDKQELTELAETTGLYGMFVQDGLTGANVILLIQKTGVVITPEDYLTGVKQQLEISEGIKYETGELYKSKLGNEEYYRFDAKTEMYGVSMEQNYFTKAFDDYLISVIITTTGEGQLDEIINCFE